LAVYNYNGIVAPLDWCQLPCDCNTQHRCLLSLQRSGFKTISASAAE